VHAITISGLVSVIAALGAVLGQYFGAFDKLLAAWRWLRSKGHRSGAVPTNTLIAMPVPRSNALLWGNAKLGDQKGMQVMADISVTNISSDPLNIPVAILRYRRSWWQVVPKEVRVEPMVKDLRSPYSGAYAIPSKACTGLRANFIFPEVRDHKTGDFIASVAVVDQFGNEHWLKALRFRNPDKPLW